MNVPRSVKWIKGLIYFRIIAVSYALLSTLIVLVIQPKDGALYGFGQGIFKVDNLNEVYSNPYYIFGKVSGEALIPLLTLIPALIFINKKMKIPFWIALGLSFVF